MPTLNVAMDGRGARTEARQIGDAVTQLLQRYERFDRASDQVDRSNRRVADSMGRVRRQTREAATGIRSLLGTFAGVAGARAGLQVLGGYEESLARVRGVAIDVLDPLEQQEVLLDRLAGTARELGRAEPFTASESARGLLNLSRAGFDAFESIDALPGSLRLALVAETDLDAATRQLASTLRAFKLPAEDATRVADVLANQASRSDTNITELGEALKFAAPVAVAANIPLEQTAAILGTLADEGLRASIGGTGFRNVVFGLVSPTEEARRILDGLTDSQEKQAAVLRGDLLPTLDELGERQLSAGQAAELFNRRGAAAGVILSTNTDKIRELTRSNEEAIGTTERQAALIGDTLPKRYLELTSAIQEAVLASGDAGLLGSIKETTQFLTSGVRSLTDYQDGLTGTEAAARDVTVALGVAGLFGAVRLLGTLVGGTGPGLLVLGIGGLIGALNRWGNNTEIVSDKIKGLRQESRGLADDISDLAIRFERAIEADNFEEAARIARRRAEAEEERAIAFQRQEEERDPRGGVPLSQFRPRPGDQFDSAVLESALSTRLEEVLRGAVESGAAARAGFEDSVLGREITRLEAALAEITSPQVGAPAPGQIGFLPPDLVETLTVPFDVAREAAERFRDSFSSSAERLEERARELRGSETDGGGLGALQIEDPATVQARDQIAEITQAREDEISIMLRGVTASDLQRNALIELGRVQNDLTRGASAAERALIDRELGIELAREQAAAVTDLLRIAEQAGVEVKEEQLEQAREQIRILQQLRLLDERRAQQLEDERRQEQIRQRVRDRAGRDIAASIVGPIRQGVLDRESDISDIGRDIVFSLSQSVSDNLLFQPLEDALGRLTSDLLADTGLSSVAEETAILQAGVQFAGTVTTAGTTLAGSLAGAGSTFAGTITSAATTFASIIQAAATAQAVTPGATGLAISEVGRVIPMEHGSVVLSPQFFPLADGRTGLRGEAGPEGVVPLRRMQNGDLGVQTDGGGGGRVMIHNTYHMTVGSESDFRRTTRQIARTQREMISKHTGGT